MTLFELSAQFQEFVELVESGEIPIEAISDTFDALNGEIDVKIDNTACYIKALVAEADAIKAEESALAERRKRKEKTVDHLKKLLSDNMARIGKTKFESARSVVSFRASKALVIDDEEEFKRRYPDFCKTKTEVSIVSKLVTDSLKEGKELSGAHIETRQNIQIK